MTRKNLIGKNTTNFLFTVPALVIYAVFFIFPVILGCYYSMTDWNGISKHFNFIGFDNFVAIIRNPRFQSSLTFNAKYAMLLIICVTILSLGIALMLNTQLKGVGIYKSIYFFPAVLSLITVGLIFNEIFYRVLPFIGENFNIRFLQHNILSNSKTAMYGILMVNVWRAVAIPTVLFMAGLKSVPTDLYEAASIDGANAVQRFFKITVPYLIPTFSMVFILQLKSGMVIFDYILALTDGGPGGATESIGILIYKHGFEEFKFGYAVAESVVLFIILAIISLLQIRLTKKKDVTS